MGLRETDRKRDRDREKDREKQREDKREQRERLTQKQRDRDREADKERQRQSERETQRDGMNRREVEIEGKSGSVWRVEKQERKMVEPSTSDRETGVGRNSGHLGRHASKRKSILNSKEIALITSISRKEFTLNY